MSRESDEALDEIQRALSGEEWDADTMDKIVTIVQKTGRTLRDPADEERFWTMVFRSDHMFDLVAAMSGPDLTCIIDEERGGIIGYTTTQEIADDVVEALNLWNRGRPVQGQARVRAAPGHFS